jgi:hypothetical protein
MLRLWQAILFPPLQPPQLASPPARLTAVHAELQPLVGGPSWLPLHVVVDVGDVQYDFLPCSPVAQETTVKLLSGRAVPGIVRARARPASSTRRRRVLLGYSSSSQEDLQVFAKARTSSLRLFENGTSAGLDPATSGFSLACAALLPYASHPEFGGSSLSSADCWTFASALSSFALSNGGAPEPRTGTLSRAQS